MPLQTLLSTLGPECNPDEEAFLLFSQSIPSQNLGFVDSEAASLELTIRDRELSIHQSPTILTSNRDGGTTGAVVWKITPLFASWIAVPDNPLFQNGVLSKDSTVLELGCGISGLIALSMASMIKSYTLTDQEYIMKLLKKNIEENLSQLQSNTVRKARTKSKKPTVYKPTHTSGNITTRSLDWETDDVASTLTGSGRNDGSFDVVIACDCIYNDALIEPLVQTCADVCLLRRRRDLEPEAAPTLCIVAQQLRSAEVFEIWLVAFHKRFQAWRLTDSILSKELGTNSGFVVHVGIVRE